MAVEYAKKWNKWVVLLCCVVLDVIGACSYMLPGLGEATDSVWAPLSAWLLYCLFQSTSFSLLNMVEELLPFTDFIPSATLAWVWYYYRSFRRR
jgi:hypothetical protein